MSNRPGFTKRTLEKYEYAMKLIRDNPDLPAKAMRERAKINSTTFNQIAKLKNNENIEVDNKQIKES